MRPLKVLYIIGTLDVGGAERQLVELVCGLDRRRFAASVCCLSHGGPLIGVLTARGVPVEVIGFRGFRIFRYPHCVAAQLIRLLRFVRRERPDIVHGFLFWAYVLGAFSARAARVPRVVASRRSLGHFKADKPHFLFFERLANRLTNLLVANSEAVRQDVIRQERVPAEKVRVIHNGINVSRYRVAPDETLRDALDIPEGHTVVTVIANLIQYKGHRFLLEACRIVRERYPRIVVLLVGDGPCRAELEGMANRLGLASTVRFLGSRTDIPQVLALTDLVAHPSLEEGFPNAVLEAMAAGKAVVATDVGGISEAVVHGETGLLVPPGDPTVLAEAIVQLLQDPARAAAMGRAGQERAISRFGMDRMVRETEGLYEELLRATRH